MSSFWKSFPPGWFAYDEWDDVSDELHGGGGDDDDDDDDDGGGDDDDDGDGGGDGGDGGGGGDTSDEGDGDGGVDFSWGGNDNNDRGGNDNFDNGDSNDFGVSNRSRMDDSRQRQQDQDQERRRQQDRQEAERQRQIAEQRRQIDEQRQRMEDEQRRRDAEQRQQEDRDGDGVPDAADLGAAGATPGSEGISQALDQQFTDYGEERQKQEALFDPKSPDWLLTSGPAYKPPVTLVRPQGSQARPAVPEHVFDLSPDPAIPTVAANAAAKAAADAGGSPEDIAHTAETAARMASDRQTLAQQSSWTRAAFRSTYGANADQEWLQQHKAELDRNRTLYGSSEPTARAAPLAGTPAGTPVAPDRRIGQTPPPAAGQEAGYGINYGSAAGPSVQATVPGTAQTARAAPAGATAPAVPAAPAAPAAPGAVTPNAPAAPGAAAPAPGARTPGGFSPGETTADTMIQPTDYLTVEDTTSGQKRLIRGSDWPKFNQPVSPTIPSPWRLIKVEPETSPQNMPANPSGTEDLTPIKPVGAPTALPPATTPSGLDPGSDSLLPPGAQVWEPPSGPNRAVPGGPINEREVTAPGAMSHDPSGVESLAPVTATPPLSPSADARGWYPDDILTVADKNDPNNKHEITVAEWDRHPENVAGWDVVDGRQSSQRTFQSLPPEAYTPPTATGVPAVYSPQAARTTSAQAQPAPAIRPLASTDTALTPGMGASEPAYRDPVTAAIRTSRPLSALASLAATTKGPGYDASQDAFHIANGIAAMLRGDRDAQGKPVVWAEPYLNDVARLAWSREEAQNGKQSDPRNAPVEYVEKWKDAFYGADEKVPLVKEIQQEMIDNAAARTPPGKPFQWQDVYGPTGEKGLISHQVDLVDCGPNAFSTILRSRGYLADPRETFNFAIDRGYHSSRLMANGKYSDGEFSGPAEMVRMLKEEAGLQASSAPISPDGTGWEKVDSEIAAGRPVMLSSRGHYWVVSAKDPNTGKYYAGGTTLTNEQPWLTRGGFTYRGAANTAIFTNGDVDPNSRAVTAMNLKPPQMGQPNTRPLLSGQTEFAPPAPSRNGPQPMSAPDTQTADWIKSPGAQKIPAPYRPMVVSAATSEGVDPDWVTAIMMQESKGDPTAISPKGAAGLMQLIPSTARSVGVTDPMDPAQSIRGGARYFKQMLDLHGGDPKLALAAYNAGPGAVKQYGGIPPYAETQHYVNVVTGNYNQIKAERGEHQRGPAAPDMLYKSPADRLGERVMDSWKSETLEGDSRASVEQGDPGLYGGPRQLAPLAERAMQENPWDPDPAAQEARHAGMRAFIDMSPEERSAIYDESIDRALTEEGIIDPAEKEYWKRNMKLVSTGDRSFPGENPGLNPFMMAGENRGTPLYASSTTDKSARSNELNSAAMGYYQFIIHDPVDPKKDPYGHKRFIPPDANFFDPVTQHRMFIRAIRSPGSKHHGDPASVVREKRERSDHTWGP